MADGPRRTPQTVSGIIASVLSSSESPSLLAHLYSTDRCSPRDSTTVSDRAQRRSTPQSSAPSLGQASAYLIAGISAIEQREGRPIIGTHPISRSHLRHQPSGPRRGAGLSTEQEQRRIWLIHETALLTERIARAFNELENVIAAHLQGQLSGNPNTDGQVENFHAKITNYQRKYDDYHSELQEIDRLRGARPWGARFGSGRSGGARPNPPRS
jgi:hypothetical protein